MLCAAMILTIVTPCTCSEAKKQTDDNTFLKKIGEKRQVNTRVKDIFHIS